MKLSANSNTILGLIISETKCENNIHYRKKTACFLRTELRCSIFLAYWQHQMLFPLVDEYLFSHCWRNKCY